jgi:hypothetical protein
VFVQQWVALARRLAAGPGIDAVAFAQVAFAHLLLFLATAAAGAAALMRRRSHLLQLWRFAAATAGHRVAAGHAEETHDSQDHQDSTHITFLGAIAN